MNTRLIRVACCVTFLCGWGGYRAVGAASSGDETSANSSDSKQADPTRAKEDSLAVRLARAQVRLAEIALQKAQQFNRKVPNTISAPLMAQFADDLEAAKAQLRVVTDTGMNDPYRDWLTRAELALRAAESKLKKATAANQVSRGAVDPVDVERLRLTVEVASLRWERGKSLEGAGNEAKIQWELEMLTDGLARVMQQTLVLSQNRLSEF